MSVVNNASGGLPTGWSTVAIGTAQAGNRAQYANGAFTLNAQSESIWDYADGFLFAYQPASGDLSVTARITGIQTPYYNDRFGIMIRDGLSPSSPNVFFGVKDFNTLTFQGRDSLNTPTSGVNGPAVGAPYWVRLTRRGNVFTAFGSADGQSWTAIGTPRTIAMAQTVNAGLAVASADSNYVRSATFDNVSIAGSGATGADFSISGPANPPSVGAGAAASWTYTVVPSGGFNGQVTFSIDGLPSGVTGTFSPRTVSPTGATTLNLNTSSSTSTGSYALTITATSGTIVRNLITTLVVADPSTQAPTAVSVTPNSGSGATQIFSFVASSASGGTAAISWTQPLFSVGLEGTNSCYMHFDTASSTLYLRDDTAPSWAASGVLGSSDTLSNSQCQVDLAASSAQPSGNTLTKWKY